MRPTGRHITAMGSDIPGKQELDSLILKQATIIACDSKSQCIDHGETHYAIKEGLINESSVCELGEVLMNSRQRANDDITVADLTGIATQDIKISMFVLGQLDK